MKILIFLFCFLLTAYVVYTLVRADILYNHSQDLFATAGQYSTDYYLGLTDQSPFTLVVLGDSTGIGVGTGRLEDSYAYKVASIYAVNHYVHVVNRAVSGARLADLITNQLPNLAALAPNVVLITIGANDATHFTNFDGYKNSLTTLINSVGNQPYTVLLGNTPNMALTPAFPWWVAQAVGYRVRKQNMLESYLMPIQGIRYIDIYTDARLDYSVNKNYYASDLFHPAAAGYQVWAAAFAKSITD